MRHQVGDGFVAQVADAGEHGDAQSCDGAGNLVLVEDQQVGLCAAAAYDDHRIEGIGYGGDLLQSADDGADIFRSLYQRVEGCKLKGISVGLGRQAVPEILIAGRSFGGYDGDALDDPRQCQGSVGRDIPIAHAPHVLRGLPEQSFEYGQSLGFELAEGEAGVNIHQGELQTVDRVKIHTYADEDMNIIPKALAGLLLESAYACGPFCPGHGIDLCEEVPVALLHQIEIVKAFGCVELVAGDICEHPVRAVAEMLFHGSADTCGEGG